MQVTLTALRPPIDQPLSTQANPRTAARDPFSELTLNNIGNLSKLEAQASYIISETYATITPTALMFSGGKDSAVLAHLLKKTFTNSVGETIIPFPFFHYDSGDNFPEVLDFCRTLTSALNVNFVSLNVHDAYERQAIKTAPDNTGSVAALVELINYSQSQFELKGLIGGGRRDEDPVRAKERIFSLRNNAGQWNPSNQRPELWNLYNTKVNPTEHLRIFPISNWTEINVWEYITANNVPIPSIYYAHEREVYNQNGIWKTYLPDQQIPAGERVVTKKVRCRTAGDRTTTGFIESDARTPAEVLLEVKNSEYSERAGRQEDRQAETSMENRKSVGWF